MDNAVLTVSQSKKSLTPIKQKKIKKYTLSEALPAFQTTADGGELDWGKPQGKEI